MDYNQKVDITKTTSIKCEKCNNDKFVPVFFLRRLSRFLTTDGYDRIIPLDTLACSKCGHINKEFLPEVQDIIDDYKIESKENKPIIT